MCVCVLQDLLSVCSSSSRLCLRQQTCSSLLHLHAPSTFSSAESALLVPFARWGGGGHWWSRSSHQRLTLLKEAPPRKPAQLNLHGELWPSGFYISVCMRPSRRGSWDGHYGRFKDDGDRHGGNPHDCRHGRTRTQTTTQRSF